MTTPHLWPDKYDITAQITQLWPGADINAHVDVDDFEFAAFELFVEGKNFPGTHVRFTQFDASDPFIAQHHLTHTAMAFSTPMAITDTAFLHEIYNDTYEHTYRNYVAPLCDDSPFLLTDTEIGVIKAYHKELPPAIRAIFARMAEHQAAQEAHGWPR